MICYKIHTPLLVGGVQWQGQAVARAEARAARLTPRTSRVLGGGGCASNN